MKKAALYGYILLVFFTSIVAGVSVEAIRTDTPPKIDGVLDDWIWKQTRGYSEFISFQPEYGKSPKEKTVVFMAYDADNLYFGIKCYDKEPEKIVATLAKRDESNRDDRVGVSIDSRNNGQNAYSFISNPLGIQQDGVVDSQAYSDKSQDFLWESVGSKDAEGFSVEIKIPFQSLRFSKSSLVKMRVAFWRKVSRHSEQYTFPGWKLGAGSILDQFALVELQNIHSKRVLEVLPSITYMSRQHRNDIGEMEGTDEKKVNLGLSGKIGLTSDLTLDLAVNPDFSHIEADEGQVDMNLRAKPLKVEKRPFFQEGLEHFLFAGAGNTSPVDLVFHSRVIKEPIFGLKLSGKVGKSGILNSIFVIDDESGPVPNISSATVADPGNNYYGILRYKQLFNSDSYLGGIYTSKEYRGGYYRLGGLDSKVRLNGYMTMEAYFLYSFKRKSQVEMQSDGSALGFKLKYDSNKYVAILGYDDLANSFELDTGRLLRGSIRSYSVYADRGIFTSSDLLKRILIAYSGVHNTDKTYQMDDYSHAVSTQFDFPASSSLKFTYEIASDVVDGVLFKRNRFYFSGKLQANKNIYLQCDYSLGGWPNFYNSELGNGNEKNLYISLQFQPSEKFYSILTFRHRVYRLDVDNRKFYDISIYRSKTMYQLNKYLSFRGIVEYYTETKKLVCDALAEFTYIPGTVIHLGYGPTLGKEYLYNQANYYLDQFKLIGRAFFFKASYLFRF